MCLLTAAWFKCTRQIKQNFSNAVIDTVYFPSFSCRFHPHVRRQFKREERDDREPRVSVWISKWSKLYLGDCGRRREQDSHRLSVFCSRGGIWLFIVVWWTPAPGQLQNKVGRQPLCRAQRQLFSRLTGMEGKVQSDPCWWNYFSSLELP